jgi:sulfur-oxidizing protein SoxB
MVKNNHLTILQMNDSHGYIEPHQELFWAGDHGEYRIAGGYARINAIINEISENKKGNVLIFDCGDTIHGTYAAVKTKGEALVPILNKMNFDAMTAHWEFAYGPKQFKKIANQLNYPMLAINCYEKSTDKLIFNPYIIKEVNDLKIGIIGIAATIADKVMPKSFSKGIYFTLGNEELPYYIEKLRNEEKVDLIILISHLGFPQEVKLANEVDGIDVLLSAHTHNRLYKPVITNKTIIIQSGCHGSFLGRLDIEIHDQKVKNFSHELITVRKEIEPDEEVDELVNQIMDPYRNELNSVVGHTATGLNRNTVMEATMDNFLLQSLLDLTGAQMAFSNGWRYGAPIPPGPITLNDLWNIIPVNPPVSTVSLTGKEIWMMMEENLEHTFSRDPYMQMGGYVKRCMGINVYFKVENPKGHRIQELFVHGKRVKPDESYNVAFVTSQGVPPKYGENRQNLDMNSIKALKIYLNKNKQINASLQGTIVPV